MLFGTRADKSCINSKFRKLLNHPSSKLREAYRVELFNGQIGSTHEVLKYCTLTLNSDAFLVNLMPMVIGSFDVIIGMNW